MGSLKEKKKQILYLQNQQSQGNEEEEEIEDDFRERDTCNILHPVVLKGNMELEENRAQYVKRGSNFLISKKKKGICAIWKQHL